MQLHFSIFPEAHSYFGDGIMYDSIAHAISIGKYFANEDPFAFNLPVVLPTALAYSLLGVSLTTDIIWDEIAFLLTIPLTFLIGKELYDSKAGLISALLWQQWSAEPIS